jgi:hypothetical protein
VTLSPPLRFFPDKRKIRNKKVKQFVSFFLREEKVSE